MEHILRELFRPSLPPRYVEPVDIAPEHRRTLQISPIADLLKLCKPDPNFVPTKTQAQIQELQKQERKQAVAKKRQEEQSRWNPNVDPHIVGSQEHTLFVAKLKHSLTEKEFFEFFSRFGNITRVRIVYDKQQRPRGYGFIVYDEAESLQRALREANNALIGGSRVIVDSERGRSYKWLPARLGGGRGGRQAPQPKPARAARGAAFRGAYRGQQPRVRGFSRGGRGGRGSFTQVPRPYDRPSQDQNRYRSTYQDRGQGSYTRPDYRPERPSYDRRPEYNRGASRGERPLRPEYARAPPPARQDYSRPPPRDRPPIRPEYTNR